MSILANLEAALEAKWEAEAEHRLARRGNDHDEKVAAAECVNRAIDDLHTLLTDDTIAALVAVARAADELSCIVIEKSLNLDWEYPRGMCKGCEQEALCAALEPLVKEADDE